MGKTAYVGPKRVVVIQNLAGKSKAEALDEWETIARALQEEGYAAVRTPVPNFKGGNITLKYLAHTLSFIGKCNAAIYCADGWRESRGCTVVHAVCKNYKVEIIND